jgi:hypothetical protein
MKNEAAPQTERKHKKAPGNQGLSHWLELAD